MIMKSPVNGEACIHESIFGAVLLNISVSGCHPYCCPPHLRTTYCALPALMSKRAASWQGEMLPIHMDDCYERLDGIFLIGRPVSSHPATFTIDTLLQIARYSVTAAFFLINAVPHNPDPAVEELLFQHLFCDMDLSLAVLRRHARFCRYAAGRPSIFKSIVVGQPNLR